MSQEKTLTDTEIKLMIMDYMTRAQYSMPFGEAYLQHIEHQFRYVTGQYKVEVDPGTVVGYKP